MDVSGKLVLITGGARGIGLETARCFLKAGSRVVITDRDEGALERAAGELGEGERLFTRVVDVTDGEAVVELARWTVSELGDLDVLINNAGVGYQGTLASTSLDTWRRLIDVNLMGALYHIDAYLPRMLERRSGHIVNVSSGQAFFRLPAWGAYSAVKCALAAMSETLHYELRGQGVWVTTVYPFLAKTAFYDGLEAKSPGQRLSLKLIPLVADSARHVGERIFHAVVKRKRVEMVNPINNLGLYCQVFGPAQWLIGRTASSILAGGEGKGD
ncbi:MAG: SDR family oxidoreductase [Deltaproteobacteria bacterium]|nr:MAG: SDR family oxidoreductase [Deltaproteobacteria bacterium]